MSEKYVYHGIDITLDVYEKIRSVVELIAEKEGVSFEAAYILFSKSKAYVALQNTNTLMWSESAEYIRDDYYRSIK